jgi:drug/metabolite transporter, DME family
MSSAVLNRLLLVAAAVLFSTGGAAIKSTAFTGWQVAGLRSGVAALALATLIPEARRGWDRRVWLVGAAYAATLVLFVLANRLTTSANAIFLQDTAPLYLLLIGPLLLHEPVRRADLVFLLAMALGMACFFAGRERAVATAPNPLAGNELAALAGIAWALTLAGLRWLAKHRDREGGLSHLVVGNVMALGFCLPAMPPVGPVHTADVLVILYLGVFQIGLAYLCLTRAMRHVPAFPASVILLVEPALNPIWAWVFTGERPGAWAIAGGTLILGSTFASAWWQARVPHAVCAAPRG